MKSAQQAAQNWQNSQGRATTAYTEGVNNFSGDWAGALLRQKAVMQTNWQQAVSSNLYDQAVNNVGTGGWKAATAAKSANYGVGFSAGASKYQAASNKIMNALSQGVGSLPPRGDINQNLQRSAALALYLHSLKGTLGA